MHHHNRFDAVPARIHRIRCSTGYTATTVNTGNQITSEYYTVGLYTYNVAVDTYPDSIAYSASDFTPTTAYVSPGAAFRYYGGKISGTDISLSPADMYLVIFATNVTGAPTFGLNTYNISSKQGVSR